MKVDEQLYYEHHHLACKITSRIYGSPALFFPSCFGITVRADIGNLLADISADTHTLVPLHDNTSLSCMSAPVMPHLVLFYTQNNTKCSAFA